MPRRDRAVILPRAAWDAARRLPAFWDLLRVGRVANALTLAYPPLMGTLKRQTPRARRERTAALLYAGALLSEGLEVARSLGKHFANLRQYRDGFGRILGDQSVADLQRRFLRPLRNKAAFHVDRDIFQTSLPELDFKQYNLATATEWRLGAIYFDIVDEAILAFLTKAKSDADHLATLDGFMTGTARLSSRYLSATHALLPRAFRALGARGGWAERVVPEAG